MRCGFSFLHQSEIVNSKFLIISNPRKSASFFIFFFSGVYGMMALSMLMFEVHWELGSTTIIRGLKNFISHARLKDFCRNCWLKWTQELEGTKEWWKTVTMTIILNF